MKKITVLLLALIVIGRLFGQDTIQKKTPQTKIEVLFEKEGTILRKEIINLGSVGGIEVSYLKVADVKLNLEEKGLMFSKSYSDGFRSFNFTSFLDADEVNGLLSFLEFAKNNESKPIVYTEYIFNSRGNFKGVLYTDVASGKLAGEWKQAFYTDDNHPGSATFIRRKDNYPFYEMILRGRDLIMK